MQLIDAIYDPDEDNANDSVRYGYVLEQFERLRIIYADLDDPDAGPAPVLPSSGVDEDALAEVIGFHRLTLKGQCACGHALSTYGTRSHDPEEFARHIARAVAAWLEGQGNAARE